MKLSIIKSNIKILKIILKYFNNGEYIIQRPKKAKCTYIVLIIPIPSDTRSRGLDEISSINL